MKNLEEEGYYVDVEDGCAEDVVVHLQLVVPAAHDQLGVDQQVHAVYDCEETCQAHCEDAASQEEQIYQADRDCNPYQAAENSLPNEFEGGEIFFCGHCEVGQAQGSGQGC